MKGGIPMTIWGPTPYAAPMPSATDQLAYRYQIPLNPYAEPGRPTDTFHRSEIMISQRYQVPGNGAGSTIRQILGAIGEFAGLTSLIARFFPPAAPVAVASQIIAPVAQVAQNLVPVDPSRPYVIQSQAPYNPWFR